MKNLFTALFFLTFLITAYSQDTLHVRDDYPTIQAAIDAANNGDIVLVAEDTYYENINFKGKAITVASHFLIDSNSTHIDNTIIDGSQPVNPDSGSVVVFVSGEDTTSILCGFTITGGSGTYDAQEQGRNGGGIFCFNSGCKIVKNQIMNNSVDGVYASGGGISTWYEHSTAYIILRGNLITHNTITASTDIAWGGGVDIYCNGEIVDNIISYNQCFSNDWNAFGGGINCYYSGTAPFPQVLIKNNNISHNTVIGNANIPGTPAAQGGGIRIRGYQAIVQGTIVTYNSLSSLQGSAGGGIHMVGSDSSSVLNRNIIKNNSSVGIAGGIGIHTSDPILTNNIVAENSGERGGGISFYQSNPKGLINNTIINNEATTEGGGLHIWNTDLVAMNNIIWGNHAPADSQIYIYTGGSIQVVYSDVQGGWSGTGNINSDPFFVDTSYNLADSSLCIGAGIDSIEINGIWYNAPLFDFDGDPRPNPPECMPDIGAQESPLCEPPTNIEVLSTEIPNEFSLEQNYPNPFNPTTTIVYGLREGTIVELIVFDVLGREVETIVNREQAAGHYEIEFNASRMSSGIYFYKIQAGGFIETKKMVMMK